MTDLAIDDEHGGYVGQSEVVQEPYLDALADTLALRDELDELTAARVLAIVPNVD